MRTTGAAFLGLLITAIVFLIAGVGLTRHHWRADVPPYGRQTSTLDVLRHPEKYATGPPLLAIRGLNLAGATLLTLAAGMAVFEILRLMSFF